MHWSQSLASGNRFGFQREICAQKGMRRSVGGSVRTPSRGHNGRDSSGRRTAQAGS
jgi:hypothetical protein